MSLDFFLGPDLFSLLRRYVLLILLRCGWFFINGAPWVFFLEPSLTPLPWGYINGALAAFAIVDGVLAFGQIGLLFGAFRLAMIHYFPARAVAWKLVRFQPSTRKPRRSVLLTALFLCSLVVLTCGLVPWAIQAWGSRDPMPFIFFLSHNGAPAMFVAAILCLLGLAWGGGHSARAAQDMTTSFRITLVGEDHWLYQRVKRIAEELGLPTPKVGITNVTNAFAMGTSPQDATVIIGSPLFKMEEDELDAIIGHELGHVMSNDVQRMQFAEGFQIMLGKVISFATIILAIFAAAAASQSKTRGVNSRMGFHATMGVGNLIRGTVFIASELVVKGISRSREFHADAVGAQVTSTEAMVRALQRIHGVEVKASNEERQYGYLMFRGAGLGNLFGTHPTLNARVKSLEARARLGEATDRARLAAGFVPAAAAATSESAHDAEPPSWEPSLAFRAGSFFGRIVRSSKGKSWRLLLGLVIAAIVILPALNSYYQLDRRAGAASTLVVDTAQSSWGWVSDASQDLINRWFGRSEALAAREREIMELKLDLAAASTAHKNELTDAQNALANAKSQLDASRSTTLSAQSSQRKAEQEAEQLRSELNRKEDMIRDLETRLVRETQDHAAAAASRSVGAEEAHAAQRRLNTLLDSVTQERDDLTRQVSALELQLRERPTAVTTDNVSDLEMRLSAAAEETNALRSTLETASTENSQLRAQVEQLVAQTREQSKTISEWAVDRHQMQSTNRDLQRQVALGKLQIDTLNARLASQQAMPIPTRAVWSAAAMDQVTGSIYVVPNQVQEEGAKRLAVTTCKGSGGRRCNVLMTNANGCISLARIAGQRATPDNWALRTGNTWQSAETAALAACNGLYPAGCETRYTVCSPDDLSKPE